MIQINPRSSPPPFHYWHTIYPNFLHSTSRRPSFPVVSLSQQAVPRSSRPRDTFWLVTNRTRAIAPYHKLRPAHPSTMPTLKHLTCHVEWASSQVPLSEFQTAYADGYVETYIAVPSFPTPFEIRLTSNGYIAPGLAMFVFVSGSLPSHHMNCSLFVVSYRMFSGLCPWLRAVTHESTTDTQRS
jgi:hypothetical protein